MRQIAVILLILGIGNLSNAQGLRKKQRGKVRRQTQLKNLKTFDEHLFHFGFLLGYNAGNYYLKTKDDFKFSSDSITSIQVVPKPGLNLGLIASMNLHKNFKVRFAPALSFQERRLEYYLASDTTFTTAGIVEKPIEIVTLDAPILAKIRTDRINNFAAYAIVGGRYSLDMSSQSTVDNEGIIARDQTVKVKRNDIAVEIGGGFDFFMRYFKFGIELKYGHGINNLLMQDDTQFSRPIESLNSRVWTISFTFEG